MFWVDRFDKSGKNGSLLDQINRRTNEFYDSSKKDKNYLRKMRPLVIFPEGNQ